MKTKSLTSSFLIFSIWCGLFAPFVRAQQPNPTPTPEPKGLQFRISEGSKTPEKRILIKPTNAENLDESSTNDIFRRLPEMPAETVETVEKASFNIRPDSPKPPKTGNVIEQKFPADEILSAPNVSNSAPQSLEIERFSPSGNVPVVTDFSVTFSQPMIAVSTQESASETVPVKISPIQIKRYESGSSQPPLDVIKNLAKVLQVSTDELIFGEDERQPSDDLKLQFEAVSRFPEDEKKIVKALLEGMILKHEAKRWANV